MHPSTLALPRPAPPHVAAPGLRPLTCKPLEKGQRSTRCTKRRSRRMMGSGPGCGTPWLARPQPQPGQARSGRRSLSMRAARPRLALKARRVPFQGWTATHAPGDGLEEWRARAGRWTGGACARVRRQTEGACTRVGGLARGRTASLALPLGTWSPASSVTRLRKEHRGRLALRTCRVPACACAFLPPSQR